MNSRRIFSIWVLLKFERLIDKSYLTESTNINKQALIPNHQSLIGQICKPSLQDREEIDNVFATKTLDSIYHGREWHIETVRTRPSTLLEVEGRFR